MTDSSEIERIAAIIELKLGVPWQEAEPAAHWIADEFAGRLRAGASEADQPTQGEPVAWAHDTPCGRAYSFADELGKAFPGLLSAPPTAGQPEGVEALAADDGPIACAELYLRMQAMGYTEIDDGSIADGLKDARITLRRIASAQQAAGSEQRSGSAAIKWNAWISDNDIMKLRDSVDDARNIRMSTKRTHLRTHPIFIPELEGRRDAGKGEGVGDA